jgi:acyl-CoA thioesterase-1
MPTRRLLLAALTSALALPAAAAPAPVVTILGDSITAGLGLRTADALPAQLEAALRALKVPARVRGAGVSGDTTAGGLARLDFSVQPDTVVCVVALGANDLLQGVEVAETRANLDKIIRRLKRRGVKVVLAGGRAPWRTLGAYGRAFDALFPATAAADHVALAPDLLAGVMDRPEMKQADGLHPNAAGVKLIAARLAPVVARALAGRATRAPA